MQCWCSSTSKVILLMGEKGDAQFATKMQWIVLMLVSLLVSVANRFCVAKLEEKLLNVEKTEEGEVLASCCLVQILFVKVGRKII